MSAPPREALLVLTLINHPWLLEEHCEAIAALHLTAMPLIRIREVLLDLVASGKALDSASVRTHLKSAGLESAVAIAERAISHKSDKFASVEAETADVEAGWRHMLALHETQVGLRLALKAAEEAWAEEASEAAWARIAVLQAEIARRSEMETAGAA